MQKIRDIFETLLSLILPKDSTVAEIENLTEEKIVANIETANIITDGKYRALFQYKDKIIRRAIWEIKYRANKKITGTFSKLLYEFILDEIANDMAFSNFYNPLIIPIPGSRMRVRERGFNQCELIVKEIKKLDGGENFEINLSALKKIRETPYQSKLKNRTDRLKNLKGCFSADTSIVYGRCVILVDDVITTGTTMKEASKTLHEAGAKKVIGFSIAH